MKHPRALLSLLAMASCIPILLLVLVASCNESQRAETPPPCDSVIVKDTIKNQGKITVRQEISTTYGHEQIETWGYYDGKFVVHQTCDQDDTMPEGPLPGGHYSVHAITADVIRAQAEIVRMRVATEHTEYLKRKAELHNALIDETK